VYLTGIVRDKLGRKMSKSLGNSPDPILLIEKFGADGVRVGMLLCSPAGNDLPFDESLCEQGRNFSNKIWNAFRLINGWTIDESLAQPQSSQISVAWFRSKFQASLELANDHFSKYRISEALMALYKLMWDDFCSWYLEMIKPAYQQPIDRKTYDATVGFFEQLMKALHPFMPFITEELWHFLGERKDGESIMMSAWPAVESYDTKLLESFNFAAEVITAIRGIRKDKNMGMKEAMPLMIKKNNNETPDLRFDEVAKKLCVLSEIRYVEEKPDNAFTFISGSTEFYMPVTENVDVEAEIAKLLQELDYN
jgi:valyl-tRNA synthetase